MLRGLPFRKEEGRWSGHSGNSSSVAASSAFCTSGSSSWFAPSNSSSVTPSGTPIACMRMINIMDAHGRSQGCSGNAHAHCSPHIPLKLYSNHFNLPSLYNLMYNCPSSVKDLAPSPKHVLKLGQPLNNQREHCNSIHSSICISAKWRLYSGTVNWP